LLLNYILHPMFTFNNSPGASEYPIWVHKWAAYLPQQSLHVLDSLSATPYTWAASFEVKQDLNRLPTMWSTKPLEFDIRRKPFREIERSQDAHSNAKSPVHPSGASCALFSADSHHHSTANRVDLSCTAQQTRRV